MRPIREIIVHCSATVEDRDYTVADIDRWHRQRGFDGIGYHYVIYRDGSIHAGRPMEKAGAHCLGHNTHSIGICYIGGLSKDGNPKDTRTPQQKAALRQLIDDLTHDPLLMTHDPIAVHGHNEFAPKACPCFDVQTGL